MDDSVQPGLQTSRSPAEDPPCAMSSTPPPTKNEVEQNLPPKPVPALFFTQFALQSAFGAPQRLLNPEESILCTEIQEITPEEFSCSIEAAARSTKEILSLKLPRSYKRIAEELSASLSKRKRRWEATGVVSDNEDIKITDLS
ncbi:hypothetical protein PtB15_3B413 [Puccinia triticina]|nr:hypothetical protein PtB15_3B413 [Puccinia triticina]